MITRFTFVIFLLEILLAQLIRPNNGSYLLQAISGHIRIMCSRKPIKKILKINHLDFETQNKLEMVLMVREYASRELGLPRNKSYTVYSEIKGKYPGWNVYSAPKFSVVPKLWCFPVAGCVIYRGYFSNKKALEFANAMKEKGFDVFVGPFNAYSTLGWYNDPILSTQMSLDSIQLAGLIIHELAHQEVYVSGDSRFDEGFAVCVEREGVRRWLKSIGRDDQIAEAFKMWDEEDMRVKKILNYRSCLNDIYLSGLDSVVLLQKKDSVFQSLKMDLYGDSCAGVKLPKTDGRDLEINNAYLVPVDAYYSLVPKFNNILNSCNGNFPQFFEIVKKLGKLPIDKRKIKLESWSGLPDQLKP